MRSLLVSLVVAAFTSLALAGCVANIPSDRFSCVDTAGCPAGFECTGGFCIRGGTPPACTMHSECDDGDFCNGTETCGTSGCLEGTAPCPLGECLEAEDRCNVVGPTSPVRFVQADPRAGDEVVFSIEGTDVVTLSYGETSGVVEIPQGTMTIVARSGDLEFAPTMIDLSGPSIFVLRRVDVEPEIIRLADDLPPAGATISLRLVDATLGLAPSYNPIYDFPTMGVVSLDRRGTSDTIPVTPGPRSFGLLSSLDLLAWFSGLDLRESTYVIFAGDTQRHLGAPDGPRLIVVGASGVAPTASDGLVYVLSATSDDSTSSMNRIYTCAQGAPTASPIALSPGQISRANPAEQLGPTTGIGVSLDMSTVCDFAPFTTMIDSFAPARRHLILVAGSVGNNTIRTLTVSEPAYDEDWIPSNIGVSFTNEAPELVNGEVQVQSHEGGVTVGPPIGLFETFDIRIPPTLASSGTLDVVGNDVSGTPRTFGPFTTPSIDLARDQVFVAFVHTDSDMLCLTDAECTGLGGEAGVCLGGVCELPRLRYVSAPYGEAPTALSP